MFLVMCFAGAEMNKKDIEREKMINMSEEMRYDNLNITNFYDEGNDKNNTFMVRLVGKFADTVLFAGTEGMRTSVVYGYDHPQYNFKLAYTLLIIVLVVYFMYPALLFSTIVVFMVYCVCRYLKKVYDLIKKRVKDKRNG